MWRHYVYIHFRGSDQTPFYVGKGSARARAKAQNYERAYIDHYNNHWYNIANKHGFIVQIVMSCRTDLEAQYWEKKLIKEIGRYDLGLGPLVNLTDGGEGHSGSLTSEELREKRRINSSGPRSQVFIDAVRAARKNGGNGGVVKFGDKLPESWRANLAKGKLGAKNPWFGKPTPISRKVICTISKQIYPTVSKAAEDFKLNMKSLYNMLSGHRHNFTSLRFYDGV